MMFIGSIEFTAEPHDTAFIKKWQFPLLFRVGTSFEGKKEELQQNVVFRERIMIK